MAMAAEEPGKHIRHTFHGGMRVVVKWEAGAWRLGVARLSLARIEHWQGHVIRWTGPKERPSERLFAA